MASKQELLKHLEQEGFSREIINSFKQVERQDFVPNHYKEQAYENMALPMGYGQTISQPSTIAFMLDKLELEDGLKILEVGSGCGYVIALLDSLVENFELYGTEIVEKLVHDSRYRLSGKQNIYIHHTQQDIGLPDQALFDRILVSAAAESSLPQELIDQLKQDGVIVCPVRHCIIKAKKEKGGEIMAEEYPDFAFVPLIKY